MNQPSTTAGTWAPDWRALKRTRDRAIVNIPYANDDQFNEAAYGAIVDEYQRQAAAAGWVLVRREDLETLLTYWGFFPPETLPQDIQFATTGLIAALAATPAPTPGEDAG